MAEETEKMLSIEKTAFQTGNYRQLLDILRKEKDPKRLIPQYDEHGREFSHVTVAEAIKRTERKATESAHRKAMEYLVAAKKCMEEHRPREAQELIAKGRGLFMLPVHDDRLLSQYSEKTVKPELEKLGLAERLLKEAGCEDDTDKGWKLVEQVVSEIFPWVGGVEQVRRTLLEQTVDRAKSLFNKAQECSNEYEQTSVIVEFFDAFHVIDQGIESAEQSQRYANKIQHLASTCHWDDLVARGSELLKGVEPLLDKLRREKDKLQALNKAVEDIEKSLVSKEDAKSLQQWEKFIAQPGNELDVERYEPLKRLRLRMNRLFEISAFLNRLEVVFKNAAISNLDQLQTALLDCGRAIEEPDNKEFSETLRVLKEKLSGRMDYLIALDTLESEVDGKKALRLFDRVAKLQDHPDREMAVTKSKEIRARKKKEAELENILVKAKELLASDPREAYLILEQYKDVCNRNKKEFFSVQEKSRARWERKVTGAFEKALAAKPPDPGRLRALASEITDELPPPKPLEIARKALARAAEVEADSHMKAGRWNKAAAAWREVLEYNRNKDVENQWEAARLNEIEGELQRSANNIEIMRWLAILVEEMPKNSQALELQARYFYNLATQDDIPLVNRNGYLSSSRQSVNKAREILLYQADRTEKSVITRDRLDTLEKKIIVEVGFGRRLTEMEEKLQPSSSQADFEAVVRDVKALSEQSGREQFVDIWWRETSAKTISALEETDSKLGEENLWDRFETRSKILTLDPNHTRGQSLLRQLPAMIMDLNTRIEKAVEDRIGMIEQSTDLEALDVQEARLLGMRSHAQVVYEMAGSRFRNVDQMMQTSRSALGENLGKLQGFLRELGQVKQWRIQAQLYLKKAHGDGVWINFDSVMNEVNRSGFGEHRSIRALREERNAIEDRRKHLSDLVSEIRSLAEDPEGRCYELALQRMEVMEKDPRYGDPSNEYGFLAALRIADPFSGKVIANWEAARNWLQDQKTQIEELTFWLADCGISDRFPDQDRPENRLSLEMPKGIMSWPDVERIVQAAVDEGRFDEGVRKVQATLSGLGQTTNDNKPDQAAVWADGNVRLLALEPALDRLSHPPMAHEQSLSKLAVQLLEVVDEERQKITSWVDSARKKIMDIKRLQQEWIKAESELDQAFRELHDAEAAKAQIFGRKQRIQETRERARKALIDCRAIAPKHPTLAHLETHPLING